MHTRREASADRDGEVLPAPLTEAILLRPQDEQRWPIAFKLITSVLSLLVIGAAVYQLRGLNLHATLALVPSSPLFWLTLAACYLAVPCADWMIYRHLWRVGPAAFGALVRKLVYNELLLSYVGDAYFYTWARKHVGLKAAPFGTIKDVAILSAAAGNLITVVMLIFAWPVVSATQMGMQLHSLVLWLIVALAISCAALIWQRQIFLLGRKQLSAVFALHVARIVAGVLLLALLWHLALPSVPLGWWLLLGTIRLLVARLPLVPNHDVVFAGIAVFELGHDGAIASVLSMVAALILLTHLLVGCAFAISDLASGSRRE